MAFLQSKLFRLALYMSSFSSHDAVKLNHSEYSILLYVSKLLVREYKLLHVFAVLASVSFQ